MLVKKLICTNIKPNQIILNPTTIRAQEIISEALNSCDRCLQTTALQSSHSIAESLKLYRYTPICLLSRTIDYILTKEELSSEDNDFFKKALSGAFNEFTKNKNLLGEGYHDSIYRINDKYAIKCPHNSEKIDISSTDKIRINHPQYGKLNTYYGQEVMSLGKFKILHNLGKHIPAGIPNNIYYEDAVNYYYCQYLPTFAKVPQESFDKIVQDCATLNEPQNGYDFYAFDYMNPNNVVLKDNNLYWVDSIIKTEVPCNSITQLLDMLLLKESINKRFCHGYDNSTSDAEAIFRKIILASARSKLKIRSTENHTEGVWKTVFRNLNLEEKPEDVISKLENIYKIEDTEIRLKETNNLLNSIINKK